MSVVMQTICLIISTEVIHYTDIMAHISKDIVWLQVKILYDWSVLLQDAAVRQSVQRLYKQIMPHVSSDMIGPFFPVLSAHLCCAMTHIHDDIQLDSLSLLGEYYLHKFIVYFLCYHYNLLMYNKTVVQCMKVYSVIF